jgi:zinc protease
MFQQRVTLAVRAFLIFFLASTFVRAEDAARGALRAPVLEHTKLPNGLDVWIEEDHRAPLVAIDVRFDVGSGDDPPGQRGMAAVAGEILERGLTGMFDGTSRGEVGAALGGGLQSATVSVGAAWTRLSEIVAANSFELALFNERDRIVFVADDLTVHCFENARSKVFANPVDITNHGNAVARVREILYGHDHLYGNLTPADGSELQTTGVETMRKWLNTKYLPVAVTIVGDVSPAKAFQLLEKYWGNLRAGSPRPIQATPQLAITGPTRRVLEASTNRPFFIVGWPTPKLFDRNDLVLDILSRTLAHRLRERLVVRDHSAAYVISGESSLPAASTFSVDVWPAVGHTDEENLRAIDDELERIRSEGPTDSELAGAKSKVLAGLASARDGLEERAGDLQYYLSRAEGDPAYFLKTAESYTSVTQADVSRAAANLPADRRVVLSIRPNPSAPKIGRYEDSKKDESPKPRARDASSETAAAWVEPASAADVPLPFLDPQKPYDPPLPVQLVTREGFRVQLLERHDVPLVRMSVVVRWQHPFGGIAAGNFMGPALYASHPPRSDRVLLDELLNAGAGAESETNLDRTILRSSMHTDSLPTAIEKTMAVLRERRISEKELDRVRTTALLGFTSMTAQTKAFVWTRHLLAPATHRYATPVDSGAAELSRTSVADLQRFFDRELQGAAITIDVVGDVTAARLGKLLGARPLAQAGRAPQKPIEWAKGTFLVQENGAKGADVIVVLPRPTWPSSESPALDAIRRELFDRWDADLHAHGINSWSESRAAPWDLREGAFDRFAIHVEKDKVAPFVKMIVDRLEGLRDRVKMAEYVTSARSKDTFWIAREYKSSREALGQLDFYASINVSPRSSLDFRKGCRELTVDQTLEVVDKYYKPEHLRVVALGDVAGAEADLKKLPIAPPTILSADASGGSP